MEERFLVLGRAGSGKTHLILKKFVQFVKKHREDSVIFILPTHSQVEHLRDQILRTSELKGYHDTGLVTFHGLSEKILDNLPLRKLVYENGKDIILSNIFKDVNTGYFSRVLNFPGFKRDFLNFVREIKENSLNPQSLKTVFARVNKKHSPLNSKYNELVTLYGYYQQALKEKDLMDKEDLLTQALNYISGNEVIFSHIELLLVDGFHDYTQLELKLLKKLASIIPNIYISLPYDRSNPFLPVFNTSYKTSLRLAELNLQEIHLYENMRTSSQVLRHIESNIFSASKETTEVEKEDFYFGNYKDVPFKIIIAANMQDEVGQIARNIRRLTYESRYRFEHIAVIFRNITKYQDIVEDTFKRFDIPVRIYAKKPLKNNPLIKTILDIVNIFIYDWQDDSVWKVLKSNIGLDKDLINKLELEYLLKGNMNDRNKWIDLTSMPELKPINDFLTWLTEAHNNLEGVHPFSFYCKWYVDIVTMLYKPAFSCEKPDTELLEIMKSDASALREFLGILNNAALGELVEDAGSFTLEEFNHILNSQIALASYRKIDRRKNVVNVIDALEARQWEIPVVFVGGLLEKEFPRQIREDLFMKDFHRRKLNATGNIILREACEQVDEERYLFYIAITRAKERLYLTYPATNSDGNMTLPSFFLSDIKKLFTQEILQKITIKRNLSRIIPEPEEIITLTDSKNFVYYHLNSPYIPAREQKEKDIAIWLYNNIENGASFGEELYKITTLLDYYNNLKLKIFDKRIIKKINDASTGFNATRLRDYAQCPYKYFGSSTLRLKQVAPKTLDSAMQGRIIHQVLEEYFKATKDMTKIFNDIFNKETRGMVIGFEELKIKNEMLNTLSAFEFREKQSAQSTFSPSFFEKKFGDEEQEHLKISDGDKGYVEISGKIDRIDVSEIDGEKIGMIIDYKYGQAEFKLKDIEEGTDLQLPIYILALRDIFKIVPIGAEFYALKSSKKTGIYNQELIDKFRLNIKTPKNSLDNDEFNRLLEDTKKHIVNFSRGIRIGRIALEPKNIDLCGEGKCDFANVCRIDKWKLR